MSPKHHLLGQFAEAWKDGPYWHIRVLYDGLEERTVELDEAEARNLARLILEGKEPDLDRP